LKGPAKPSCAVGTSKQIRRPANMPHGEKVRHTLHLHVIALGRIRRHRRQGGVFRLPHVNPFRNACRHDRHRYPATRPRNRTARIRAARHRSGIAGADPAFPRHRGLARRPEARVRPGRPADGTARAASLRQGTGRQVAPYPYQVGPAGPHAAARHRKAARRRLLRAGPGGGGQGADPGPAGIATAGDRPRQVRAGLERRADPADTAGGADRRQPEVRHRLVRPGHRALPRAVHRSAGRVVLSPALRPDLAAVLPGRDRQGAGPSRIDDAQRAGPGAGRHFGVRNGAGHVAHICLLPHHQPHRRDAGRAAVPPPAGPAAVVFPGPPGGRQHSAGARAGDGAQLPDRLRPDPGDRPCISTVPC
jgi:hypothetical protein